MSQRMDLAAIRGGAGRDGADAAARVPRPAFRWGTRVVLPLALLAAVGLLIAWSARDAFAAKTVVRVAPVVPVPVGEGDGEEGGGSEGVERVLVQAPGWFEPDPFAVGVTALVDGVVEEVLALEGEHVEAGQVVATLVDEEAELAVRRAEAELREREAAVASAQASVRLAEAREAEVRDEVERKRTLGESGAVGGGQLARLELRLRAAQAETEMASVAERAAAAAVATQAVEVRRAALALERTKVRSPVAGVVLSRTAEPGTRVSMRAGEGEGAELMRVYDPSRMQVRVDVPLSDAAKVGAGTRARIVCEALAGVELAGEVSRVVHRANLERNTVQFKVRVEAPHATIKPEMLARVKFVSMGEAGAGGEAAGDHVLMMDARALVERNAGGGRVWVVWRDARGGEVVARREVTIGGSREGMVEVMSGLTETDRVVIDPPAGLREGERVVSVEDAPAAAGGGRDE